MLAGLGVGARRGCGIIRHTFLVPALYRNHFIQYKLGGNVTYQSLRYSSWNAMKKSRSKAVTYDYKQGKRRIKSQQELDDEEDKVKVDKATKSGSLIKKWGAIASTHKFNKKATKWYVAIYGVFLVYGMYYFKKLYSKETEKKAILDKRDKEGFISEWERLRVRELSGDLVRTRDQEKLDAYHKLKDIYDEKLKKCQTEEEKQALGKFDPEPEDIEGVIDRRLDRSVLPSRDLSGFYDKIAEKYDRQVGREELMMGMGRKRKWVMRQCKGDVLEVASGTGRNCKWMNPALVTSYTFLDPSKEMMKKAYEKFKKRWPDFSKVKFVVGKAEDLKRISSAGDKNEPFKYDTIVETFGLCSEKDPVQSLKNMKALLKQGGRIILLEHGRSSWDLVNKKLDKDAQRHSEKWGCRWNLDIGEIVDDAGLEITKEKRAYLGTNWMVICKRPEDIIDYDELNFFEKYFSVNRMKNFDSSLGPNEAFGSKTAKSTSMQPKDEKNA
ncbi:OMS1 [Brettanomyces bruxellensis]|uniref:DEBR0S2_21088g1_1 n=2 Tax=Dekkera bruxellensis TaxID=5007 RepID=A0A7D9CXC5_DEKBR|nr:OMS1 [Brettanomyces bruxellensis]